MVSQQRYARNLEQNTRNEIKNGIREIKTQCGNLPDQDRQVECFSTAVEFEAEMDDLLR